MSKAKQDYNASDIITYEGLEAVRKKIAMYAGSASNQSITQSIVEMISNSIDEHLAGYGSTIEINLNTLTNTIVVRDYGRGIPPEKLEEVFTKLHSSGKFEKEGKSYGATGGTHGVGNALGSALGTVRVKVFRGSIEYAQEFTYKTVSKQTSTSTKEKTGTQITWTPDPDAIEDTVEIKPSEIHRVLAGLSYPTPGLEFKLKVDNEPVKIYKSKSLADFLYDHIGEKNFLSPVMEFSASDNLVSVECAMVWSNQSVERAYLNLIPNRDGGSHVTSLRSALTRTTNKLLKEDLKGEEVRRGLSYILSVKTLLEPQFSSQAKDRVVMQELGAPLSQLITPELEVLIQSNRAFFTNLAKSIQRARNKESAQTLLRELTAPKPVRGLGEISEKYKGCTGTSNIELYLVEGDSALGGANLTKNHTNQAIYALRGKPKNTFDQDLVEVLKNKEIEELIKILGSEQQAVRKFDKIILAADADVDGLSIVNLLLGFLITFYKDLLLQGKVYIPELPKYMATSPSGEHKFLSTDKERDTIPKSWDITYFKGLGEMNPPELGRFLTNRTTRKLHRIRVDETGLEELENALQLALSKDSEDVENRRDLLI